MDLKRFEYFYFDRKELSSAVAQRALSMIPKDKVRIVDAMPFSDSKGDLSAEEFDRSKKNIYFTKFKGQFFKRCPGARPGLACCNYFVLNLGQQCDLNCSYCYLQSFLNSPILTMYTNVDQALSELENLARDRANESIRIGTGEVIDSLSLDPLTGYSETLIPFFKKLPHWKLELKTKSAEVDHLLHLGPAKNVLTSWSINPPAVIESEEKLTASFDERLKAAEKCREAGFSVSFHIDPVIWHPEWKENYSFLVDQIATRFSPADVPIMSVGALRFQPEQRALMRDRFGFKSMVTSAEVFPSGDGKLRYDKKLRLEMYEHIVNRFKSYDSRWNIFFCMEAPETWLKSHYSSLPKRVEGLSEYFDSRILKKVDQSQSSTKVQP